MLAGKGIIRVGYCSKGEGIIRAGYGSKGSSLKKKKNSTPTFNQL